MSKHYENVGDLRSLEMGKLAKPSEKVSTREPQFKPLALEGKNPAEPARIKYLRIALQLVGVTFIVRNLHTYPCLAVWLVVAHGPPHSALSSDDSGCLCDAGDLFVDCQPQPLANLSLIWFTVWSSVVHAVVMAAQALANPRTSRTFGAMSWRYFLSLLSSRL